MSSEHNFLDVKIMGREYRVACTPEERDGLLAAYYAENRRRPQIRFHDTAGPDGVRRALLKAREEGAQMLVGPLTRDDVNTLFGLPELDLPVVALNRGTRDGLTANMTVISGAGLVGYGELIIIKHSDQWLSAYGHNRKRLVNEGQSVKAGEQIAEMGRTGANRDMLHFEIRYNGKPVDPQQYLPAR